MINKNNSMLAKWVWRFANEESTLWRRVICAKYDVRSEALVWKWRDNGSDSSFVKAVGNLYVNGSLTEPILRKGLVSVLGDGRRIDFWTELGGDALPLMNAFPRIYVLSSKKTGSVDQFGVWQGQRWVWNVPLRRSLFDWEKDQWEAFMCRLDHFKPRRLFGDALGWSFCSNGIFTVSSFRRCLEDSAMEAITVDSNFCWQGICPHKIEVFTWQLLSGRIMVSNVMNRFGFSPNMAVECPFCKSEEETIDHLFLHCIRASEIWVSSRQGRAWNSLFFAIVWTIWESRNHLVFSNSDKGIVQAVDMIKFRVAWWFKHHGEGSSDPITVILQDIAGRCFDKIKKKAASTADWSPPSLGAFKFNVDGSARGNPGSAGIGGVLRDFRGKVIGSFSKFVGIADAITAEIFAIHQACVLCANSSALMGKQITIISDSKGAVSWVNSSSFGSLKHVNVIYDIRNFLRSLGRTVVIFNPRSSNCFADSLAKKGSNQEGDYMMWEVD
ncbi:hypothetical protein LWI29_028697 [Acer saccharum]|uniref:RNase H type-1 domain-containing protein n=1 Tax=Acer saccharum TaxID=4024 RepID=A0AA39RIE1_ACESA|nr:hypothetical protein LWI29_028697 [Acer saccharum]